MGAIRDAAVPGLVEALRNPERYVRLVAAWTLGEIGDVAAVPGLLEALCDPEPDVRETAVLALGKIEYAAVASALAGDDPQARTALAEQLEAQAQWAEDGESAGSPYLALTTHLRTLLTRLREGDGDEVPGDAG